MSNGDQRKRQPSGARQATEPEPGLIRHLVIWAADTDRLVDDLLVVDAMLGPVTEAMATVDGVLWATHDLDRESVCFTLMVESRHRGRDNGLAEARLRARTCLRRCLHEAGLLASTGAPDGTGSRPVRLRLDDWPLQLQRLRAPVPVGEGLN